MPVEMKRKRFVLAVLPWVFLVPSIAISQTSDITQSPETLHPLEPSDTSSLAATLNSLIDACNELDRLVGGTATSGQQDNEMLPTKERILDCLDLSELPKELRSTAGIESALYLKEVLDRIDLPADKDIPSVGDTGEPLMRWRIPGSRLAITRIDQGPQQGAYLFTPETVRNSPVFF